MAELLQMAGIQLNVKVTSQEEAVRLCGTTLEKLGYVTGEYTEAMWQRERDYSSFVGRGVAMPHGTAESRKFIKQSQLVVFRFKSPVDWNGNDVQLCFGLAALGDEHGAILAKLAEVLIDDRQLELMFATNEKLEILKLLV